MKKKIFRTVIDVFLIVVAATLSAVGLYTFVNPANFAPSGVDGISMMVQKLTGLNMGYVSLAINIPLLIIAWFFISKKYVIYTSLFTVMSSVAMIVMEKINMYEYVTENHVWIAVFASGIMLGVRTAVMIRIGGSTGGVDIIACIVQKKKPYMNIESLISLFCYVTIGISFFVYRNIESVIMSVIQTLIFNLAMNSVLKPTRNAVEVRIITNNPQQFKDDILLNLKHGATVIDCHGMFTGEEKAMIVTIINIHQMDELIKLSRKYDSSFVYFSEVGGVWGNFRWHKSDVVK
ncbi:MAG: YitT family protein [Clostridia bacterium]|nr:YitT family protein [Clostridia bacterium]